MESIVKHIGMLFLLALSMIWIGQQEESVLQEVIPQEHRICTIVPERPITERAIGHLSAEQIAIPMLSVGEIPGYHPHHSKPKCLHTNIPKNRYAISSDKQNIIHHTPNCHHVIDYYIYTLEHILI